jgi:hypothetical protein
MVLLLVANNNSNNKQNQTIRFTIINTYFALHGYGDKTENPNYDRDID